jgi:AbrB family looped-hinge helix DNA binding protein
MAEAATLTSKGQITIPSEVRTALGVKAGDKIVFERDADGKYRISVRKFRSLIDIARENPIEVDFPIGDLDELINDSVAMAAEEKEQRIRQDKS